MHFSTFASFITVASSLIFCYASSHHYPRDTSVNATTPELPFNFTYLFTAQLSIGGAAKPIPIPGGVRIVEHILNGTVTGPAINAIIEPSLATPSVFNNGTTQVPVINVVGTTDDGFPFYLYELGIGSPSAQVTRIELEVGGGPKYAALRDGYILASVQASADRKSVEVMGYLVQS